MTEDTTRRRFLRDAGIAGAAATGVLALGAQPPARAAAGKQVAVLGGGVAGLTAAHELADRGFQVTVYERNVLGGKARSIFPKGTGTGGRLDLPGEHGFRFFPGFYFNLTDNMRRTPFAGNANGCWDNLTRATAYLMARSGGRADLTAPFPFPLPPNPRIYDLASFSATIISGLQTVARLTLQEATFAAQKLLVYVSSCDDRRLGQWEKLTWADYIRASWFSDEYNKFLADGTIRNLAATKSKDASAHSVGFVGEATVWSILDLGNEPGGSVDRVLDGSTSEMWLDPWIAHLTDLGVKFNVGYTVDGLQVASKRITGAHVTDTAGNGTVVTADYYIVAMPCERAVNLLSTDVLAADPTLASIKGLKTDWMSGLQFFLKKPLPLAPGHVNYVDSAWAVTSISQAQFWKRSFSTYGDGTVQDCLSTIVSDWFTAGTFNNKQAKDCTPAEIAAETWAEIKAHLNDTGTAVLTDDMLHSWFLDPAIGNGTNDTPLFIQQPGSWALRPNSRTAIPNLFLAGDWVKTPINVTTMEGANQGGRQAVNALLDAAGSSATRCDVHQLYKSPIFALDKVDDQARYKLGLPNKYDLLDTRWP